MTQLADSVVLVTGANGGLGTEFVGQALKRGATRVYATARNPREWEDSRVVPLRLDVTDPASIMNAAAAAADTTVVINNAGVSGGESLLTMPFDQLRVVYEALYVRHERAPCVSGERQRAPVAVGSVPDEDHAVAAGRLYAVPAVGA
jgi:NAD(P)-dependent dehydrogenase (short-subunit alcohol dehydrogenase family)